MPPDSDTIEVQAEQRLESPGPEAQIDREMDLESLLATPTQPASQASIFELPILPPNKRQANFSPEKTRTHGRTRSNFSPFIGSTLRNPFASQNRTPKATTIEEALEIARNLVI